MTRLLVVGDELPEEGFVVSAEPMKIFSLLMADPNPVHFDAGFVERLGRGSATINQGTLNMAYPVNAVMSWLNGSDAAARVSTFRCRFAGSVYAGDHVVVGGVVTEVDPDGAATVDVWLDRESGERVLSGTVVVLPPT